MIKYFLIFLVFFFSLSSFGDEDFQNAEAEFEISENWEDDSDVSFSSVMYGFDIGVSRNIQSIKYHGGGFSQDIQEKVHFGTGSSFKFMADYEFGSGFGLRGLFGYERFLVSNKNDPEKTRVDYLGLDLLTKWQGNLSGDVDFFGQAGLSVLVPFAKESNTISLSSISTYHIYVIGAGVAVPMDEWELVVAFNYKRYPRSNAIETDVYFLNFGFLFS